jgi:catalase
VGEPGGRHHARFGSHTKDLYEAIERDNYPEWELLVQLMSYDEHPELNFDPLDDTKTWPEEQFPAKAVGRMVLNRNASNFFLEQCDHAIQERMVWHLRMGEDELGLRVAEGLGMKPDDERQRLANLGANGSRDVTGLTMTHCVPNEHAVVAR